MKLIICAFILLSGTIGARAETLVFDGRIEALNRAEISTQLDGVVTEILFAGGQSVTAGQPLVRLDASDARLALALADARLSQAKAGFEGATETADRQQKLFQRGIVSEAQYLPSRTARAIATAAVELARAERDRALLDLERTLIRAPITGFVDEPMVGVGAFVEASVGSPLGQIVSLNPVVVAYRVPYSTRLQSMSETNASSIEDLFDRIELTVEVPGGEHRFLGQPEDASAVVDPADGSVTVRARLDNPRALLRPGMSVVVKSEIGKQGIGG